MTIKDMEKNNLMLFKKIEQHSIFYTFNLNLWPFKTQIKKHITLLRKLRLVKIYTLNET